MAQMNLSMKQKQTHRQRKQMWWGWGEMDWESGVGRCKLLHSEWISNRVLKYSTGNYTQYLYKS